MRRLILLALLAVWCGTVGAVDDTANDRPAWQQLCAELIFDNETDEDVLAEQMEDLALFAAHPIDINSAVPLELCRLPFLSMQQASDIYEYIDRHGPMLSMGELRMIPSLDLTQQQLLPYFVRITTEGKPHLTVPDSVPHRAFAVRPEVVFTGQVPFYTRKGDRNGFLGYKYRHELRLAADIGRHLTVALTGAQDAGEPFFTAPNRWGYDSYTGYAQLQKLGCVEQLIVGNFRPMAGMGLVLGNTFFAGKTMMSQNLGRSARLLRPYAGRNELSAMRGAAVSLLPWSTFKVLLYGSYRPIDATLRPNGAVATLLKSAYHRTPQEFAKKHNTNQLDFGTHIGYILRQMQVGITVSYTGFDRPLQPDSAIYRRHYPRGRHFFNASTDFTFQLQRVNIGGEVAIDGHGNLAMIGSMGYVPRSALSLVASARYYGKNYQAMQAQSRATFGYVRNERGLYVGATWVASRSVQIQGYADYAYASEPRYLVSIGAAGWDTSLQGLWKVERHSLSLRYRWTLRPRDNAARTALIRRQTHRLQLAYTVTPLSCLTLKTQAETAMFSAEKAEAGWMVSHHLLWQRGQVLAGLVVAYFDTPSYDTRIYLNERQLQYQYTFNAYSGRGMRLSIIGRYVLFNRLTLAASLGNIRYFNRQSIGTGLQQIDQSSLTNLLVQVKWKLYKQ